MSVDTMERLRSSFGTAGGDSAIRRVRVDSCPIFTPSQALFAVAVSLRTVRSGVVVFGASQMPPSMLIQLVITSLV